MSHGHAEMQRRLGNTVSILGKNMCSKKIDNFITKEENENRYWSQPLAVSATTGMVGAAEFGGAEKPGGRGCM